MNWFAISIAALVLFLVLMVVGFFACTVDYAHRLDGYRSHCGEAGGHIYQVTSESALFCLTEDGRMLEVYP